MSGPDYAAGFDDTLARQQARTRRRGRLHAGWSSGLCVLVALGIWLVFFPGLLSPDSIDQYSQALRGRYHDWHPPIMAIVLSGVFALGGSFAALMLVQCVAGLLGVRALAAELLALPGGERLNPVARAWCASGIALFLLLPLSPLAFYLMTFWKDAWFAILLLWCAALALRIARGAAGGTAAGDAGRLALLVLVAGVAPLVRHNALVVLPVLCVLIGHAAGRRFGRRTAVAAFVPLLVFFGLDRAIYGLFPVTRLRPENQIKALELVGVVVLRPAALADLPFTKAHLADDFDPARYPFGNVSALMWDEPVLVKRGYVAGGPNDELGREYWHALRTFPREIVAVKLRAFRELLGLWHTHYWMQPHIVRNEHGLAHAAWSAPLRESWVRLAERIARHHRWRWVGGVAAVWMVANLLLLALTPLQRRGARAGYVLLLLLPLAYYASYLLATPSHDFRFTYPATLFVQVVLAATFTAWLSRRVGRDRA